MINCSVRCKTLNKQKISWKSIYPDPVVLRITTHNYDKWHAYHVHLFSVVRILPFNHLHNKFEEKKNYFSLEEEEKKVQFKQYVSYPYLVVFCRRKNVLRKGDKGNSD